MPGQYRYCSPKIVADCLSTIEELALVPVTLQPSGSFTSLGEALLSCPTVSKEQKQKESQGSSSTGT